MSRPTQQFIKGQTILLEGTPGDRAYRIISGEVVVCKRNHAASLVPIAKLYTGEIFGEMYLFEQNRMRTATVIACSSEVMVEVFYQDDIQHIFSRISPALQSIAHGISRRLQRITHVCVDAYEGEKKMSRLPDGSLRHNGTSLRN